MQVVLFIIMLTLKYIFSALSFFALMNKRKMPHKYIAFVPILNSTFTLGNISDSINKDYFKKTFNRLVLLMSWLMSMIFGCVSMFLLKIYIPDLHEKILNSVLYSNSSLDITHVNVVLPSYYIRIIIFVCSFLFILSLIINFVLSFSCFYTIYKEYNKNYSLTYILLAIFCNCFLSLKFIPPLLVLLIYKNTTVFDFLNKIKTKSY